MSRVGNCSRAPATGGAASGQCCCAFKDQEEWGQRWTAGRRVSPRPRPLLRPPQGHIGFLLCFSYPMAILAGRHDTPKSLQFWFLQK